MTTATDQSISATRWFTRLLLPFLLLQVVAESCCYNAARACLTLHFFLLASPQNCAVIVCAAIDTGAVTTRAAAAVVEIVTAAECECCASLKGVLKQELHTIARCTLMLH